MRGTIVQQGVRYAEYDSSGMLHSWWRKLPGASLPKYVEKLDVLSGRTFAYDVSFNDTKDPAAEETDGWPKMLPDDLRSKREPVAAPAEKKRARDLLS